MLVEKCFWSAAASGASELGPIMRVEALMARVHAMRCKRCDDDTLYTALTVGDVVDGREVGVLRCLDVVDASGASATSAASAGRASGSVVTFGAPTSCSGASMSTNAIAMIKKSMHARVLPTARDITSRTSFLLFVVRQRNGALFVKSSHGWQYVYM